jgi:excisionase family DNA binding protein
MMVQRYDTTPAQGQLTDADDGVTLVTVHDLRALVYTVPEVAQLLTISRNTAYTMVRTGQIPARRLGTRWVVPRKAFHAWLDATPLPDDLAPLSASRQWR